MIEILICYCILSAHVAYAASVDSMGPHSDFLIYIIGGLCVVLFTVGCFALNRTVTLLSELQVRMSVMETRCQDRRDAEIHGRRKSDN